MAPLPQLGQRQRNPRHMARQDERFGKPSWFNSAEDGHVTGLWGTFMMTGT
ncbi:MAG TPA: hypothetical protein VFK86_07930 [Bauldia sp.]|nr:hypothetical protein [Bauldia sp.]